MLLNLLLINPLLFALLAASLVLCLTIHEFAHAWTADRLGDPTPRIQGRLTLNPLAHLDPLGTVALLLVGFGWGRPVQFDPYNLQHVRRDTLLIALAGPVSNLILALLILAGEKLGVVPGLLANLLVSLNIALAAFNLIPVHPLDGGKILAGLLPEDLAQEYDAALHQYGTFILLLLLVPWAGGGAPISYLVGPLANFLEMVLRALLSWL